MYVLKARLIVLGAQLREKAAQHVERGTTYKCPNMKCRNNFVEIDEAEQSQRPDCSTCGMRLKSMQQAIMRKDVENGCNMILEDLHKDIKDLQKYKIPPPFFGPIAAVQASKSF